MKIKHFLTLKGNIRMKTSDLLNIRYIYRVYLLLFWSISVLVVSGCKQSGQHEASHLFTLMPESETNITFNNQIADRPKFNILDYLYFYDGGGVAVGDINNDGLPDILFTGNQVSNKLYLNKGNFVFKDITARADIKSTDDEWSTGVTMADVNGDGWLDIYISQVNHLSKKGHNLLYINNGDTTFTERAEEYGLDFEGLSTQAAFFDYDLDGDLDLYLLNHSIHTRDSFTEAWQRIVDAPRSGDKLYRNDGEHFTDVTRDAGIYSSNLGYGLGLAISDMNNDGWPDIYIGNDFHENDYLYFNNGDGTFSEELQRVIGHTSRSSMGNDIADFNNDGYMDILSLDMLPEDIETYRKSGGPDSEKLNRIKQDFGYAPQYARNTLQLNRGFDSEGYPLFSEIGVHAGVDATDWSWAGLFADLDNDGWKDLFVTNGIVRRPNDLDYIRYVSQPKIQRILNQETGERQLEVIEKMPSVEIPNYAYQNKGDLTFTDQAEAWGLATPAFSNGAAYADLDNDGDLDLVVNNINNPAFIYQNNSDTLQNGHYLKIKLEGEGQNTTGIGSKILIETNGKEFYQEQTPTRGFQSSVPHTLYFGLGDIPQADSLLVIWPDGRYQRLYDIATDQQLVLRQNEASGSYSYDSNKTGNTLFREVTSKFNIDYVHRENDFVDFERQPVMPHKLSTQGPALAVGDVNGDGLDDFYAGGAHDRQGQLFIQNNDGTFELSSGDTFKQDSNYEDVDAIFFDANGNGYPDLYIVSGGGEFAEENQSLQDRLYLNDGKGNFIRSLDSIPDIRTNGASVVPADYDNDGDLDLFVGSRSISWQYGKSPASYLLENDGTGTFKDVTREKAPDLLNIGMVTDAVWADFNSNERPDLILAGEWMPITVLINSEGILADSTHSLGLGKTNGWWNTLLADDFNEDGYIDLVAGNLGTNSIFQASETSPLELFVNDFDNNGTSDPLLVEYHDNKRYSVARRDELLKQVPGFRKRLPTYGSYAELTLEELIDKNKWEGSARKRAYTFRSAYIKNRGKEGFVKHDLPDEVQFSPVQAFLSDDFNNDGNLDILTGGNFFGGDTKQGRYDASYGNLLLGDGQGNFKVTPPAESGFVIRGEVRSIKTVDISGDSSLIMVARNNNTLQLFRVESWQ